MSRSIRITLAAVALFSIASGTVPARLVAQGVDSTRPVFLALPQHFPDVDARAVLQREPGRDIVILDEADASAETLRVALLVLRRLTREQPPLADRGQLIPITGYAGRAPIDAEYRAELEAALVELRARPLVAVGNLGLGRWMRYGG